MRPIVVFACAAVTFGMLASPLVAQANEDPSPLQMAQAAQTSGVPVDAPPAEQLPPPPPFPPMPKADPRHRWVDMGDHHARRTHHAARANRHDARQTKHRKTTGTTRHHARSTRHERTNHAAHRAAHKAKPMHFSRKTIRLCHGMEYRQIMRHNSCRALMKQELAAPAHRHRTDHPRRTGHKASAKKVRHHQPAKRHRR